LSAFAADAATAGQGATNPAKAAHVGDHVDADRAGEAPPLRISSRSVAGEVVLGKYGGVPRYSELEPIAGFLESMRRLRDSSGFAA